jgi:hypothetical protein
MTRYTLGDAAIDLGALVSLGLSGWLLVIICAIAAGA